MERSASNVVAKAALCLIPPESIWGPIQEIREIHDSQIRRWMPHMNILYPFIEDAGSNFEKCEKAIAELFNESPQKDIRFVFAYGSFDHFDHENSATIFLAPVEMQPLEELKRLHARLEGLFPLAGDKRFTDFKPHLSLGQFQSKDVEKYKKRFATQWFEKEVVLHWHINKVQLISRPDKDSAFEIQRSVHF